MDVTSDIIFVLVGIGVILARKGLARYATELASWSKRNIYLPVRVVSEKSYEAYAIVMGVCSIILGIYFLLKNIIG